MTAPNDEPSMELCLPANSWRVKTLPSRVHHLVHSISSTQRTIFKLGGYHKVPIFLAVKTLSEQGGNLPGFLSF